ncbi:TPA: conserved hypothetical protein [Aquificae Joseph's Coat Spring virus]|nr:TPA: conserved hypothetical protein [Aquificae Joseph's Coat Spring virus]
MMNFLSLGALFRLGVAIVLLLAFGFDIYAIHHIKVLNQTIALQNQQIKQEQEYIKYYANLYTKMKHDCQLSKKQIIKHYSILLKEATTPIPQIQIPKEHNQCKALKEMVNEAASYFSK